MLGADGPWRALTPSERALLCEATSGDWQGATELKTQLAGVQARRGCACGCGTLELRSTSGIAATLASNPTPREGTVLDEAGDETGGLILFLERGRLASLEVYAHGPDPLPMPAPDHVIWITLAR